MVFQSLFGPVEHLPTENFLQMAEYIAGADLFIGNQSSPMSVALGVGNPIIQETCLEQPDCVFPRDNVQYVTDGEVTLTDFSGTRSPLVLKGAQATKPDIYHRAAFIEVPPGLWQYPGLPPHTHIKVQAALAVQLEGGTEEEAMERIVTHNIQRAPDFFSYFSHDITSLVKVAIRNAALTKAKTPSKI